MVTSISRVIRCGQWNNTAAVCTSGMLCVYLFIFTVYASNIVARHEILTEKLKTYDREILPSYETDDPVKVKIMLFIHNMDSVNEASMDYSLTIYLRQWWTDPRLAYADTNVSEPLQLDVHTMAMLWLPDLFFVNEKSGHFHKITVPNKLLHVFKNGSIFYSTRLSLTLSCYMDLSKYPLDKQACPLQMESYGYTADMMTLFWHPDSPISRSDDLMLPHFHITDVTSRDCTKSYGAAGVYTCIKAELFLKRKLGYYLVQVYAPSLLIVVLSWVSFWLNVDTIPARISLGVLTVLMITSQTSGFSNSLPKVSYIKAIDIWMAMCLLFVFAALIEFSIVNIYTRGGRVKVNVDFRRTIRGLKTHKNKLGLTSPKTDKDNDARDTEMGQKKGRRKGDDYSRASRLDKVSRVLFPVAFLCFNLLYWIILLWM